MLRILVCILIFICSSSLGFIKAASYKGRTEELENILELMRLLDMEITYRRDSLAKAFDNVSESKICWFSHVLKSCSDMLNNRKSLSYSWKHAIAENMERCPLKEKDLFILEDISSGLGKSDIDGHKNFIAPIIIRLEANMAEAVEQEKSQGRMYRGLGIAAGIVIAVVLI